MARYLRCSKMSNDVIVAIAEGHQGAEEHGSKVGAGRMRLISANRARNFAKYAADAGAELAGADTMSAQDGAGLGAEFCSAEEA